jgi:prephenate dehydrogenase
MQLGMIGLGRMGANIVRRLIRDGHTCVVFDVDPKAVEALEKEGATGASSIADLVAKLSIPRAACIQSAGRIPRSARMVLGERSHSEIAEAIAPVAPAQTQRLALRYCGTHRCRCSLRVRRVFHGWYVAITSSSDEKRRESDYFDAEFPHLCCCAKQHHDAFYAFELDKQHHDAGGRFRATIASPRRGSERDWNAACSSTSR